MDRDRPAPLALGHHHHLEPMIKNLGYFSRKVYWRLRLIVGATCASDQEIQYRLNRLPLDTRPGSTFQFPWAVLQYVSASDLRGQFVVAAFSPVPGEL